MSSGPEITHQNLSSGFTTMRRRMGAGMARKEVKPFLLRIDPRVLAAIQSWAEDDLRSLNGQIEYLLRQALTKRGHKLAEEAPGEPASDRPVD